MKIVFFGTPEFAAYSLRRILEAKAAEVAAVVTATDKPAGRGHAMLQSDVKKVAVEYGLPLLQPSRLKAPEFIEALRSCRADLFVVIAFRMLPQEVWSMPPKGTFNLHASLLPRYRGAAPINRAVMNGDTETGITTFFLQHEIDTGDIISQKRIDILPEDNVGTVYDKLMMLGADLVINTLQQIETGTVVSRPQPEGEYLPAPKIFREDCLLDFTKPAVQIHNQVRGLSPYPAAYTTLRLANGKPLTVKVFTTRVAEAGSLQPGDISINKGSMIVGCGQGAIEILELQPAGKKRMNAHSFLLGYQPCKAGS